MNIQVTSNDNLKHEQKRCWCISLSLRHSMLLNGGMVTQTLMCDDMVHDVFRICSNIQKNILLKW